MDRIKDGASRLDAHHLMKTKCFAIESRRIGDEEWGSLTPPESYQRRMPVQMQGKPTAFGFETREEAQAYIDANMPYGYEAQIVELNFDPLSYHGPTH